MTTPTKKQPCVMIGTPAYGGLNNVVYTNSLQDTRRRLEAKGIQMLTTFLSNESLVQRGRNTIAAKFLAHPAKPTHLLFIDADIGWPAEAVELLLSHDKDIVGAAYPKKGYQWDRLTSLFPQMQEQMATNGKIDDNWVRQKLMNFVINWDPSERRIVNNLLSLRHIGTGFMMIKREVFERMIQEMPELKYEDDVGILHGEEKKWSYTFFDCETHDGHYLSEDYLFCKRWRDLGGKVFIDVRIPLNHVGTHTFMGSFLHHLELERPKAVTPKHVQSTESLPNKIAEPVKASGTNDSEPIRITNKFMLPFLAAKEQT